VVSPAFENILKFILLQDPIKIAVGVTLAYVLSKLVVKISDGILAPFIRILIKMISKSEFTFKLGDSTFKFGTVIEQLLIFILYIFILYFLFIVPVNNLSIKYNINQKTVGCPFCMTLINPNATRCPSCTSRLNIKQTNKLTSFESDGTSYNYDPTYVE